MATNLTDKTTLDLDMDLEVECYFEDCPHPAVWSGFHKCLKPPTITVCIEHKEEVEDILTSSLFPSLGIPCDFGHIHHFYDVTWRKL